MNATTGAGGVQKQAAPDEKKGIKRWLLLAGFVWIGGVIALDKEGRHAFAMSPKSDGMYRGYVTDTGDIYVAVYAKDALKKIASPVVRSTRRETRLARELTRRRTLTPSICSSCPSA